MQIRRTTLPALAAGTAALVFVTLTGAPAGAHVTVTPSTTEAGAYAVLTFSVGHGCDSSPTTALTIALPEAILSVTPTVNPGWTVRKVEEQLAEPVADAHGNEITERVSKVVYTAKQPLADGFRDTVELSVQLPANAPGETLAFPVVQTCVRGETGWVETAAEGQDPEDLELPAPVVTLTDGNRNGTGDGETGAATGTADEAGKAESDDRNDDGDALGIASLVTGVAGLAVGGVALTRTRKSA